MGLSVRTNTEEEVAKSMLWEARVNNGHLSRDLRDRIDRLSRGIRKEMVDQTDTGLTPLAIACMRGNVEIAKYLIGVCHADMELCSGEWYEGVVSDSNSVDTFTPLGWASKYSKIEIVECLFKLGAKLNAPSKCGSTPVLIACGTLNLEFVRHLVEKGADVRKPNHSGKTCLMASIGSEKLCSYLIWKGVEINERDSSGKTALHYAVERKEFNTVELLLNRGADPFAKTHAGDDALQIACDKGLQEYVKYFLQRFNYPKERMTEIVELIGANKRANKPAGC
ncbi:protein fem-1 homolog C-like [Toxorhynchites rutilus septentrionalis]|uniref:protein fem-1 homolog C-like n=1 Tax=Toxorhynchites rutilus septentrionalis TaxID=329112 RepID=UPI00247AB814|nr:protein fem-1 homolog C-like [Toxorhynchites rutilus septentrionalis]